MAIIAPDTEMIIPVIFSVFSFSLKKIAENSAINMGLLAMMMAARLASMSFSPLKKNRLTGCSRTHRSIQGE
jgi:hypothetical protein